ncbi:hypothetical protein ACFLSJ_06300 [Verrucomicrobiota bacterium]
MGKEEDERSVDIEDIVPGGLSGACVLRYVIFLQGVGEKPRLECLSKANALFRLFGFSHSPVGDPARLLFTFAPLLDKAECFNLVLGDPGETADVIVQLHGSGDTAMRSYA